MKKAIQINLVLVVITLMTQVSAFPQTISQYVTYGDKTKLLELLPSTPSFSSAAPGSTVIDFDQNTTFQTMDGFGYMLTQGSAYVMMTEISSTQRAAILQELFNPSSGVAPGLGVSFIRIAIGASDMSQYPYTYNDLAAGQTDVSQSQFSLAGPDLDYVIPVLKEIVAINPSIKIKAVPWTAPAWMKTNGSLSGGNLIPEYYASYATYFVKYLQAMQQQGISIYAIAPQNEPEHCCNNPAMLMTAQEQINFINHLGPAIQNAGFSTKILTFDHNCDHPEYPIEVLGSSAGQYVDGAAFHLYAGDISALSTVHNAFSNKNVYFTEQYTGAGGSFLGDLAWHMRNVMIGGTNNWAKAALEWNLAADANHGPHTDGGCSSCLGAFTLDGGSVTRNVSYYIVGQMSKFVRPGATRISTSSAAGSLKFAGFVNTSAHGSTRVLVVHNDGNQPNTTFDIRYNGKVATVSLPKKSIGTYVWTDAGGSGGTPTSVHVASISTGTQSAGKGKKSGSVTITVVDNLGNPVSGATITGTFSGTFNEPGSGITNSNGSVTIVTSTSASGGVTVDFCVTGVTKSGLTYEPSQNTITCTNSGLRIGSIESEDFGNELQIYPNPVLNKALMVNLRPVGVENTEYQMAISNLSGQLIYQEKVSPGITTVHLPLQIESGIYVLEITGSRYKVGKRIVIN